MCGYISSLSFPKGNAYTEGNMIYGVRENMTLSQLLVNANSTAGIKVFDKNGTEKTDGCVATGDVIKKYDKDGKEVLNEYTVILDGDLTGDGKVTVIDYIKAKRGIHKADSLSDVESKAADTDRDGKECELRGEGLLARAICHELDHLDGKLFTDVTIRYVTEED